jgi:hypothetical protein
MRCPEGVEVTVDGQVFVDCKSEGCTLVYSGGTPPSFNGCDLGGPTTIRFTDAAERTLIFLQAMARPGSGLQSVIRDTFAFVTAH